MLLKQITFRNLENVLMNYQMLAYIKYTNIGCSWRCPPWMKQHPWIKHLRTITLTNAHHGRIPAMSLTNILTFSMRFCLVGRCEANASSPTALTCSAPGICLMILCLIIYQIHGTTSYLLMDWTTGLSIWGTSSSAAKQHRSRHWLRFLWWTAPWPHESQQKPPKLGRSRKRRPRQPSGAAKFGNFYFLMKFGVPGFDTITSHS